MAHRFHTPRFMPSASPENRTCIGFAGALTFHSSHLSRPLSFWSGTVCTVALMKAVVSPFCLRWHLRQEGHPPPHCHGMLQVSCTHAGCTYNCGASSNVLHCARSALHATLVLARSMLILCLLLSPLAAIGALPLPSTNTWVSCVAPQADAAARRMRTSRDEEPVQVLDDDAGNPMHDPIMIMIILEKLSSALSYSSEGKWRCGRA
jgi:hypothetical protein